MGINVPAACIFLVVAAMLGCGRARAAEGVDVWVDTDPSLGRWFHDADDGFALVQAFGSGAGVRVRGVSVSFGNTTLPHAGRIARELLAACPGAAGVPVLDGAAGPADLGRPTGATAGLLRASATGNRLTYLALGPLTNLATALRQDPGLAGRLERVVFLGGRRPGERFRVGRWLPYEFHDANFDKDPAAAAEVLGAGVPLTLVPMRVAFAEDVLLTPADLGRVGREGGAAGRRLHGRAGAWLRLWQGGFALPGGPLFDSLAVLAAGRPEFLETVEVPVAIRTERGRPCLLIGTAGGTPVRCVSRAVPGAKEAMLRALGVGGVQ